MKIGVEYIKYRWKAKGRHGVHSPFVYDITDKCLKTLIDSDSKKKLNILFAELRNDFTEIEIKDFGAGSRKMGSTRKVSQIFRNSSSRGKYGEFLYRLANHFKPKHILEFGTSLGVGTTYFKLGYKQADITTVEACPQTRTIALLNFEKLNLTGVESVLSTFDAYLNEAKNKKFDLVFIDGHHDGKATLDYLSRLKDLTNDETLFILDDIRWSESMFNAWNTLISDEAYHVTIDFFRFGLVTRRPKQEKEHFFLKL